MMVVVVILMMMVAAFLIFILPMRRQKKQQEQLLNTTGLQAVFVETAVADLVPTATQCAAATMRSPAAKGGEIRVPLKPLHVPIASVCVTGPWQGISTTSLPPASLLLAGPSSRL